MNPPETEPAADPGIAPWITPTTIRTAHGRWIDLANVLPSDIDIYDIAHSLSRIGRFNGHTRWPWIYSVAQHSCQVARRLPDDLALEGLLHDAAEAYIGDITRPLKKLLEALAPGVLKSIESDIERAVALQFGLTYPWPEQLHQVDRHVCHLEEVNAWLSGATHPFTGLTVLKADLHPSDVIDPLMAENAEASFLARFQDLTSTRRLAAMRSKRKAAAG